MFRIFYAIKVFFVVLFSGAATKRIRQALAGDKSAAPTPTPQPKPAAPTVPKPPVRSDAVSLLAALQREARFIDFVQEPLGEYSDAQIGAVARDVHRDCGTVLKRLFDITPAVDQAEGGEMEIRAGFDAGRFRMTGNVSGEPPYRGQLIHPGWEAKKCDLPTWSGNKESVRVIAPAEVEIK